MIEKTSFSMLKISKKYSKCIIWHLFSFVFINKLYICNYYKKRKKRLYYEIPIDTYYYVFCIG